MTKISKLNVPSEEEFQKGIELMQKTWQFPREESVAHALQKLVGEGGELLDAYTKGQFKQGYNFETDGEEELGDVSFYIRTLSWAEDHKPVLTLDNDIQGVSNIDNDILLLTMFITETASLLEDYIYYQKINIISFNRVYTYYLLILDAFEKEWNEVVDNNYMRLVTSLTTNGWNTKITF